MAEKPQRCAVYTRKSTEDGLEQEFNSLDAQYEACAAYAISQTRRRLEAKPLKTSNRKVGNFTLPIPGKITVPLTASW
jgi:hypothetical protein